MIKVAHELSDSLFQQIEERKLAEVDQILLIELIEKAKRKEGMDGRRN